MLKKNNAGIRYALLSVYDKTGIVELAKVLQKKGYQIISTGGTGGLLQKNNIPIVPIQSITGNPESFDGRVKTISFPVESGILFDRNNSSHVKQAKEMKVPVIDIVICNLYPFQKVIQEKKTTLQKAIENIDVGGPTMVRSAAKNFHHVLVVTDPTDYSKIIDLLRKEEISPELKKELAAKAFLHLSWYDAQIGRYLSAEQFPQYYPLNGEKFMNLRYGDNPHQQAAAYIMQPTNSSISKLEKKSGRELSLTNLTDINAGLEAVQLFQEPAAVIIKHNSPCGIALGKTSQEALERAIEADPVSAFGGVVIFNKKVDMNTVKVIASFKEEQKSNIDILAAPVITDEALKFLQAIRKTMGIYVFGEIPKEIIPSMQIKGISGGYAVQTVETKFEKIFASLEVVTKIKPIKKQLEQMKIAWKFISRIRSNSVIVVDKIKPMTRGIGAGQTSRIGAAQIALHQAGKQADCAILASDAFFPFADSVELAIRSGIGAIIQPGGSIRDKDSIRVADEAGIPMVFTGSRAFWH